MALLADWRGFRFIVGSVLGGWRGWVWIGVWSDRWVVVWNGRSPEDVKGLSCGVALNRQAREPFRKSPPTNTGSCCVLRNVEVSREMF